MVSKPAALSADRPISKAETGRILSRALDRLSPEQHVALLAGETPEGWAELVADEASRAVVPNRAARRARRFGRGLNVKQAAKREAYAARALRRQAKAAALAAA